MKPPKCWLAKDENNKRDANGNGRGNRRDSVATLGSKVDDSFRNYMARKIELQRSQFGLILPPDPNAARRRVRLDFNNHSSVSNKDRTALSLGKNDNSALFSSNNRYSNGRKLPYDDTSSVKRVLVFENDCAVSTSESKSHEPLSSSANDHAKSIQENKNDGDGDGDGNAGMTQLVDRLKRRHGNGSGICRTHQIRRKERKINKNDQEFPGSHLALDQDNVLKPNINVSDVNTETQTSRLLSNVLTQIDENRQDFEQALEVNSKQIKNSNMTMTSDTDTSNHLSNSTESPQKLVHAPTSTNDTLKLRRERPDLFFLGVVVQINGYTNPSNDSIMRILHRYGGDLEKYETQRVTHIIAESLSMAKSKAYKKQKNPIPVVHTKWITDCVQQKKLLPFAPYLLNQVKDDSARSSSSAMKSFLSKSIVVNKYKRKAKLLDTSNEKVDKTKDDERLQRITNNYVAVVEDTIQSPTKYPTEDKAPTTLNTKHNSTKLNKSQDQPRLHEMNQSSSSSHYANGIARTVGNDPNFLESYFKSSRLSFIGSFKRRVKVSSSVQRVGNSTDNTICNSDQEIKKHKRFVYHIDMDCFFAAVALRKYPQFADKPVAVGHGWKSDPNGVNVNLNVSSNTSNQSTCELSTCNYIARKFGVKKGMFLHRARSMCPDLIVLPYDYDGYEEVSDQVADILHKYASIYNGAVEQVSCDEAYLELYLFGEEKTMDTELQEDMFDVVAKKVGSEIRDLIHKSTQCTATCGISKNKFLAKLATDSVKPNGLCLVNEHESFLCDLKLRDLPGIGYQIEKKLNSLNLIFVRDIWKLGADAEKDLCRVLGKGNGSKILRFCYGEDDRPVQTPKRRTIGAECNYGVRFNGPYGVDYMIKGLVKEVERRMKCVGVVGKHITLKVKERKPNAGEPGKFNGHGSCFDHSKSCDLPTTSATMDGTLLSSAAISLFQQLDIDKDQVRGMGIIISKLEEIEHQKPSNQLSLWMGKESKDERKDVKNDTKNRTSLIKDKVFEDYSNEKHPYSQSNEEYEHESISINDGQDNLFISDFQDEKELNSSSMISKLTSSSLMNESGIYQEKRKEDGSKEFFEKSVGAVNKLSMEKIEENFEEILLPPISDINIDEVMLLPDSIRDSILKKMEYDQFQESSRDSLDTNNKQEVSSINVSKQIKRKRIKTKRQSRTKRTRNQDKDPRQSNVKRLFKLASIKSGKDEISYNGEAVSLTQLDSLPINIQLQLANNDNMESYKQLRKNNNERQNHPSKNNLKPNSVSQQTSSQSSSQKKQEEDAFTKKSINQCSGMSYDQNYDFYDENIAPFCSWMNQCSDPKITDIVKVKEFFCICISENRLDDVVKLLKVLKRRKDRWGELYEEIRDNVNIFLVKKEKRKFDLKGLGLI